MPFWQYIYVRGVRATDEPKQLFEKIYNETKESVYRYITAKCYDIADIDDIYQNTFINVYNAIVRRKKPVENSEAFVILIAKRQLAKYYPLAMRLRSRISLSRSDDVLPDVDLPDDISIEDNIADSALIEQINKELSKKPSTTRKVIFMYYYLGMTIPEISEETGMNKSTVKRHIYKTIEELRRLYGKEEKQ